MQERAPGEGFFVTLEGPDGAGKSSQAERLAEALRRQAQQVTLVREPGGTPLGEAIRRLLLESRELHHEPLADALLFNAARSALVAQVIRPALSRGDVVVCDRYADSTLAYQGYGSGLDLEWLAELNARATGGLVPDLTLLLDLPVDVGLARRAAGPERERTRFEDAERQDSRFHERVRDGYRTLAAREPQRWAVIDASHSPDQVHRALLARVKALIGGREPSDRPVRVTP